MIEEGTVETLTKALALLSSGAVDVNLRGEHKNSSCVDEDDEDEDEDEVDAETNEDKNAEADWSYLHLIVDRYGIVRSLLMYLRVQL